jgi:glycerol uptake facilitator-like aquaporin
MQRPIRKERDLLRRLVAEGMGTALLVAVVIGSGVMAEQLAGGNAAIALLGNTLATGAALPVLILIFGPLSGAHLNPAVSFYVAATRRLPLRDAAAYIAVQFFGGIAGMLLAHAMFQLPLLEISGHIRNRPGRMLGEFVATLLLLATIVGTERRHPAATPYAVGLVISAGYWFTSSTSFANPAVTLARAFSDSFAGIRPLDAPGFMLAQLLAVVAAIWFLPWLFASSRPGTAADPGRHERASRPTAN